MNWTEQGMGVCNPLWQLSRFITASGMQYHNQALLRTHISAKTVWRWVFNTFTTFDAPSRDVWVEHALRMRDTCTTVEPYTLDGKVCMIDWNCDLRVKVKVRVGKWVLCSFFFLLWKVTNTMRRCHLAQPPRWVMLHGTWNGVKVMRPFGDEKSAVSSPIGLSWVL